MRGDALKTWFYAAASVMGGAWMAPAFYNAGKALSESAAGKHLNGPLNWLAGVCGRAGFPDFFKLSLLATALLLFIPFAHWLRGNRLAEGRNVWSMRLPAGARSCSGGQPLLENPRGPWQAAAGFLLVVALFATIATVLFFSIVLDVKRPGEDFARLVVQQVALSLLLAALHEILFRGVVLGIFVRTMRPSIAIAMSALFYTLVLFCIPPQGLNVADPEASSVGFELLGKIAAQAATPGIMLGAIAPCLALGCVLAYARWRTASLWLPIGLHAGLLFVNAILPRLVTSPADPGLKWSFASPSLDHGLVPLAAILAAGFLTARFIRPDADDRPA